MLSHDKQKKIDLNKISQSNPQLLLRSTQNKLNSFDRKESLFFFFNLSAFPWNTNTTIYSLHLPNNIRCWRRGQSRY